MFWSQTPRETLAHVEALGALRVRDRQALISAAWHGALFRRMDTLPEHAELMERIAARADTKDQTPEDQLDAARAIVAAFGG